MIIIMTKSANVEMTKSDHTDVGLSLLKLGFTLIKRNYNY